MAKMPIVINDEKWAEDLQERLDLYMDQLAESVNDEDPENSFETLSGEYFCGCSNCYSRESLTFIANEILLGAQSGKIELADRKV